MQIDINCRLMEGTDDNAGVQPYQLYDANNFAIRHDIIQNNITLLLMNRPNIKILLNERLYNYESCRNNTIHRDQTEHVTGAITSFINCIAYFVCYHSLVGYMIKISKNIAIVCLRLITFVQSKQDRRCVRKQTFTLFMTIWYFFTPGYLHNLNSDITYIQISHPCNVYVSRVVAMIYMRLKSG